MKYTTPYTHSTTTPIDHTPIPKATTTTLTMSRKAQLEQAYKAVVDEVNSLCKSLNRPVPQLVAVSKYKPAEDIEILYNLGQRHFGENYVQELQEKAAKLPKDIQWHFIGALQSNKAKIAREIPNLVYVETLDSISKATKLNNQRQQLESAEKLKVYLQINTSNEAQKAGVPANEEQQVMELAAHVHEQCPALVLQGLMTIGSFEQSHAEGEHENSEFATLAKLRDSVAEKLKIEELGLSMGMSADYAQAIKQGSTNVRVGSNIFGGRATKEEIKASN